MFLNESITAEEFKRDLEVEAERREIVEDVASEDALGTQTSEMEVDNVGEDEVVAENVGSKGGRKRAPSSPPKLSRKQTRADEPGILVCLDTLPFLHFSISAPTLTYHDARNQRDASRELREPTRLRVRSMLNFR